MADPREALLQQLMSQAGPRGATYAGRHVPKGSKETSAQILKRTPTAELESAGQTSTALQDLLAAIALGKGGMTAAGLAFHGTPHNFDRFDLSKVGTGQGAQSFGHGIYFAENPKVAKDYQRSVGAQDIYRRYNNAMDDIGDQIDFSSGIINSDIAKNLIATGEFSAPQQRLIEQLGREDWWGFDAPWPAIAEVYRGGKGFDISPEMGNIMKSLSNLYEVNIPDEKIAKMLNLDSRLWEQPQALKAVQSLLGPEGGPEYWTGTDAYKVLADHLAHKNYSVLQPKGFNKDIWASSKLKDLGIPGNIYADQGSRGKDPYKIVFPDGTSQTTARLPAAFDPKRLEQQGAQILRNPDFTRNLVIYDQELLNLLKPKRIE